MENQWEYQYGNEPEHSGAAQQASQPVAQAPETAQPQATQPQAAQPDTGYVNVGSSGTNAANTADNFGAGLNAQAPGWQQPQQAAQQPLQQNVSGNGGNGGGNGPYDYSANFNGQPQPRHPKPHVASKWPQRIVSAVLVAAIGFGGGYAGAMVAGIGGTKVVTQTVERTATATSTSAGDSAMTLSEVSGLVSPSVVVITTEQMVTSNSWFGGQYVQSGAGSGVIMSSDGYIITCAHVVSGATSVKVTLNGESTSYDAKVMGSDEQSDIAVLKIDATGLVPAVMGNSDSVAVGEDVVAVGNPMGTLGGTVTNGIISAVNRDVTIENTQMTLLQTNASISPGNSGGGLFNSAGELIGIVNAKSAGNYAEGLGFAIPINTAYQVAQDLLENGYVTGRPQLGITVIAVNDAATAAQYGLSSTGIYIASVADGSGAAKAGLKSGDRIVSIGDTLVETSTDVTNVVQSMNVGDTITLQIARDGKLMSIDVVLGEAAQQS